VETINKFTNFRKRKKKLVPRVGKDIQQHTHMLVKKSAGDRTTYYWQTYAQMMIIAVSKYEQQVHDSL
jgi:ferritin-like protein